MTPGLTEAKIEALKSIPGAAALLEAFAERPGTYLVGGAVRDLMLGFAQFDYDVLVEGDAGQAAEALAELLEGRITRHDRFLTANYRSSDGTLSVDFAQARTEHYPGPGSLPEVRAASVPEDLVRRDFTVNAMALAIWRDKLGEITEFPDASADLLARVLRVTHDGSFLDDPTRLLRLLRYGARLGFTAEPHTQELAFEAIESGAVSNVSGARICDELLDLLAERSAVVAVESMSALGLDRAIHPLLAADEYLVARAMNAMSDGLRQELILLALCSRAMDAATLAEWLEWLGLRRTDRAIITEAVESGEDLIQRVAAAQTPAEMGSLLGHVRPETIIYALALPGHDIAAANAAREWIEQQNHDHLEISGADLRAAGVSEGPTIGRVLSQTLEATLNGKIEGSAEQLEYALELARSDD